MNSPMDCQEINHVPGNSRHLVGWMIEQGGSQWLRNVQGSGMIRLVWNSPPPNGEEFRSGNVTGTFVTGSIAVRGGALPALSDQVWKCIVSSANADQNAQHLHTGVASEPSRGRGCCRLVRWWGSGSPQYLADRLKKVWIRGVGISPRNHGALPQPTMVLVACGNKFRIEIRIMRTVPATSPPTGIQRQLQTVSDPCPFPAGTGRSTPRQSANLLKTSSSPLFWRPGTH